MGAYRLRSRKRAYSPELENVHSLFTASLKTVHHFSRLSDMIIPVRIPKVKSNSSSLPSLFRTYTQPVPPTSAAAALWGEPHFYLPGGRPVYRNMGSQTSRICSARPVQVCSSMATWDRNSSSAKYFAWTGQRRTQAWHLMHSPAASMVAPSMLCMGHA